MQPNPAPVGHDRPHPLGPDVPHYPWRPVTSGPNAGEMLPQRAYYDLNPVGSLHWSNLEFIRKVDPDSKLPIKWPLDFV